MFGNSMRRAPERFTTLIISTGAWLLLLVAPPPIFAQVETTDDWPIRLTFTGHRHLGGNSDVIRAENVAPFTCTKLRLQVSAEGATLVKGTGHSMAKLMDGKLLFDEVSALAAGESISWNVFFEPRQSSTETKLIATLNYAEKPDSAKPASPALRRSCGDYSPSVGKDMIVSEFAFPNGSRATGALLVHQVMPTEVEKAKTYTYQYYITNLYACAVQDVELQAFGFRNLKVAKSDPMSKSQGDTMSWHLGDFDECQTKVISLQATSDETGNAAACLSATFSNRLCAGTTVVEPALKIVKTATSEHLLCEEAEVALTISNPGSGIARNVKVMDDLPEGLVTTDGKRRVESEAGDLAPGQSKQLQFKVKASKTGEYANYAIARAEGGLTAQSNTTTTVFRKPVLEVACSAPEQRYIGRVAEICFDVRNKGNAVSTDSVLVAPIPLGAEITEIGNKGVRQDKNVVWNLGSLKPNETQHVCFSVRSGAATSMQTNGHVVGKCADPVEDACETLVVGIPAILLEVVDIEDPVEIESLTTYVLTVTNQGSSADTNIRITTLIPDQMEYVNSAGATNGRAEGQKVSFAPLARLDPKKKVEWKLIVRAKKPGDARLAVELSSDQFQAPIKETESTNLYK